MARGRVEFDIERCKGCELCTTACPKQVLFMDEGRLNGKGYHPAMLVDPDGTCTGCALCAVICPDVAITVYRQIAARPTRRKPGARRETDHERASQR